MLPKTFWALIQWSSVLNAQGARPRGYGTQSNTTPSGEAERLSRGGLVGEAASIPGGGVLSAYVSVADGVGQELGKEEVKSRQNGEIKRGIWHVTILVL
jgi:hypothetical protein